MDWAKYTDEGWYGNAAIRAHLFGNWYLAGDFNPAPAVPLWPFLEWVLFFFTGVTIQAARGLAVAFFFCNLLLSYLLLRATGPRWVALLALTLIVTSPFLYCFSRLAILEPMLTALTLAALNLAVRLPRLRRPATASVVIGLLFTLMMLTKTTAVFLLPALGWAMLLPLWQNRKLAARYALAGAGAFAASFGLWMALVIHFGLYTDYKYLFFVNKYIKPSELTWPLVSFWWSFHGGLWVGRILIPLAGLVTLVAIVVAISALLRPSSRKVMAECLGPQSAAGPGLWRVHSGRRRLYLLHDLPEPPPAALLCRGGHLLLLRGGAGGRGTARSAVRRRSEPAPRSRRNGSSAGRWSGWPA